MEELTLTHPDDWHIYLRNNMGKLNLTAEIAKQLRVFHQVDIPGSKEPQLWNELFKFYENASYLKFDDDVNKHTTDETILFKCTMKLLNSS
ncbi:hypothetical protein Tsubulata_018865 [Turnera subulata]|uniref:Uncharacterized protein n=1 Tax=Turnera subulata TaxID=218843 RepID=A0A9Q0FLP5_9ROSI|nr:hypothetical protein Tsubulata_018865 [Turnera subulata]